MTWLQTASGRAFDLMNPDWRQVDFVKDLPDALARIARFTGHIDAGPYSVAQHSVIGADAVYRDTRDRTAAGVFLLHDGHEDVLGDKATPIAEAEAQTAEMLSPGAGRVVREMQRLMKRRIDIAIYAAAGLGNDGCPERYRRLVHEYDLRMLATERRHLLGPSPQPWHPSVETVEPLRMVGKLTVWPWTKAADEYRERLRRYLPERFGQPSPPPKSGPRRDGARLTRQPLPELSEA